MVGSFSYDWEVPGRGLVHTYIVHSLPVTWTLEVSEFLEGWQEEALCLPVPLCAPTPVPTVTCLVTCGTGTSSLPAPLTSLAFCLPPFAEEEFLLGGEERAGLGGADHSRKATTSFSTGFLVSSPGSVWWLLP